MKKRQLRKYGFNTKGERAKAMAFEATKKKAPAILYERFQEEVDQDWLNVKAYYQLSGHGFHIEGKMIKTLDGVHVSNLKVQSV